MGRELVPSIQGGRDLGFYTLSTIAVDQIQGKEDLVVCAAFHHE